jgi:hypothetical protein
MIGQVRERHREIEVLIRRQAIESNKIFVSLEICLRLGGGRSPLVKMQIGEFRPPKSEQLSYHQAQ